MKAQLLKVAVACLSLGVLAACNTNGDGSNNNQEGQASLNETSLMQETVSSINAIPSSAKLLAKTDTPFDVSELVEKTEGMFIQTTDVTRQDSDKDGYLYKNVVTIKDVTYEMYVSNEQSFEVNEGNETEVKTKYEGRVFVGDTSYQFTAKEEVETEEGEEEHEMSLKLFFDTNSYIIASQEIEIEQGEQEEEFTFTTYVNGVVTSTFSVKREVDKKETEIEVQIDSTKYKLEYYSKNSIDYLKVTYNKVTFTFKIVKTLIGEQEVVSYELVV